MRSSSRSSHLISLPRGKAGRLSLCALVLMSLLGGCSGCWPSFEDPITRAEGILNDAINALNDASADFRRVLEQTVAKLTDDAQSTIRNEVSNLLTRSIAQTGVELRCNVDFLRTRARQGLQRILASLPDRTVEPPEPAFCQVVPVAVDRALVPDRLKQLEFYGYDFDHGQDLKVFHVRTSGRLDVTHQLDRPTHYAMTLRFGATGVQLDDTSQRFVLEFGGRQISSVAIIQPQTPVCESRVVNFRPSAVTLVPGHTRGDRDFAGHGPTVDTAVSLLVSSSRVSSRVHMRAFESNSDHSPRHDHTTVDEARIFPLFNAPPGERIDRLAGPRTTTHRYRDSNHQIDAFNLGSGGPAQRLEYVGDTSGDEAGTRTKVDVTFNRLTMELVETGDCVPGRAVMALAEAGLLSEPTLARLEESARADADALDAAAAAAESEDE